VNKMLPLLYDTEKDERFDGVILVEEDMDNFLSEIMKTTAEDLGKSWLIADWETTNIDGNIYWATTSMNAIAKSVIEILAKQ